MAWLGTNSNSLRGSDNLFKCGELDHWPFDLQITLLFIYATRKTSTKLELLRLSIVWVTSYKLFCVSTSRGSDLDRWAFGLKLQYNLHVHKYLCNNLNFLQLFVLEIRTYQECHMFLPPPTVNYWVKFMLADAATALRPRTWRSGRHRCPICFFPCKNSPPHEKLSPVKLMVAAGAYS